MSVHVAAMELRPFFRNAAASVWFGVFARVTTFIDFLTRKEKLMAFTEFEGAPLDNNTLEQTLKIVALLRKNALFFKTLVGAEMSDIIMSIGATAGFDGVDLFHYFVSILRYQKEVAQNPEAFLPWKYLKIIAELEKKAPTHPQCLELTEQEWKKRKAGGTLCFEKTFYRLVAA